MYSSNNTSIEDELTVVLLANGAEVTDIWYTVFALKAQKSLRFQFIIESNSTVKSSLTVDELITFQAANELCKTATKNLDQTDTKITQNKKQLPFGRPPVNIPFKISSHSSYKKNFLTRHTTSLLLVLLKSAIFTTPCKERLLLAKNGKRRIRNCQ